MQIVNALNKQQLKRVRELLEKVVFQNGESSASGIAKEVKQNQQAISGGAGFKELHNYISKILITNDWISKRYLPKKFSLPLINKYCIGESYGRHFDRSHMRNNKDSNRIDYSFTLMLSNFSDCDGGEIVIENGDKIEKVKLDAGDMVIYPSMNIHSVLPVIKGERIAYVGWFESHVKNPLALAALHSFEDLHLSMLKYDLSDDDKLMLSYVQNKLEHILSDS